MPVINITAKDIKRGTILEPAWYVVRIDSVGEVTSKKGDSQNYPVEGEVLMNADTGDTKYAGTPTPNGWVFNEKAMGFAISFLQALGANVGNEGGRFELKDAEGKEIEVFIENDTYEGRTVNRINHKYRARRNK